MNIIHLLILCVVVFSQDFSKLDELIELQIANKVFPGAVVGIYYKKAEYTFKYGQSEYDGDAESFPILKTTIYDMASVSKVVGSTAAAMHLWENNKLDIDEFVTTYLPLFPHTDVTIRNLLLHNSGLPAGAPLGQRIWTREEVVDWLYTQSTLLQPPGMKYIYSDLSMVTLQLVIEAITAQTLDAYLQKHIFGPLSMRTTMFNPSISLQYRIAPTTWDNVIRNKLIWGEVHDPTAFYMGGVSGNAGIFSTVYDMITYMKMMLGHIELFKYSTLEYWTTVAELEYANSRALGWDTVPIQANPPCGHKFSKKSFGHTGYTGTSIWADREKDLIIVILTNRVYPDDKTSVVKFRADASNLIVDILLEQQAYQ